MQLTAVGNSNLTVELFVFGPAQAEAKFFRAERCTAPVYPNLDDYRSHSHGPLNIVHPLLRQWVSGAAVATKLTADLNAAMMAEDVDIQWVPLVEFRRDLYSYLGACIFGLNWGASVSVAGLLIVVILTAIRRVWKPQRKRMAGWVALAGLMTAIFVFVAVPKIDVRLAQSPFLRSHMNLRELGLLFDKYNQTNHPSSLGEARAVLKKIGEQDPRLVEENFLLGGPVREEDSPGNYLLRQNTNGVEFVWFDANGAEHPSN